MGVLGKGSFSSSLGSGEEGVGPKGRSPSVEREEDEPGGWRQGLGLRPQWIHDRHFHPAPACAEGMSYLLATGASSPLGRGT